MSWFIDGSVVRLSGQQSTPERIVFCGPQTHPVVARHRGPLRVFILLLAPDAFYSLTNIGADRYLNRMCPMASVLDDSWQAMAAEVLRASTDEKRMSLVEEFLEPRWRAVLSRDRALAWGPAQRHGEWSRAAISRAATIAEGRSRRQRERHMRSMTGWSARALRSLARVEYALLIAARSAQSHINWAGVAAEAGYADQSHLCRELRRYTGLSPQQLWCRMPNEQALWVYRAWFGRTVATTSTTT